MWWHKCVTRKYMKPRKCSIIYVKRLCSVFQQLFSSNWNHLWILHLSVWWDNPYLRLYTMQAYRVTNKSSFELRSQCQKEYLVSEDQTRRIVFIFVLVSGRQTWSMVQYWSARRVDQRAYDISDNEVTSRPNVQHY